MANSFAEKAVGVEFRRIIAEINHSFYSETEVQLQRFQKRLETPAALESADSYILANLRLVRNEKLPAISTHSARSVALLSDGNSGIGDTLERTIVLPLRQMQEMGQGFRRLSSMDDREILLFYIDYLGAQASRWRELRDELRHEGVGTDRPGSLGEVSEKNLHSSRDSLGTE